MKSSKILIIGSSGYIGSYLGYEISKISDVSVSGCDLRPYKSVKYIFYNKDYKSLTLSDLSNYDTVILLAGDSSVSQCDISFYNSHHNNVTKFIDLLYKIDYLNQLKKLPPIKVIYAGSSSVYNNIYNAVETDRLNVALNNYDATKQAIDIIAQRYMETTEIYGLRFGTVNGLSLQMRWDLMINSMTKKAVSDGKINVINPTIQRPILYINDLKNAIKLLLNHDESRAGVKRGIYNLNSFNSNVGDIAQEVQKSVESILLEKIDLNIMKDSFLMNNSYDFSILSNKFITEFGWKPVGDIQTIVKELVKYIKP